MFTIFSITTQQNKLKFQDGFIECIINQKRKHTRIKQLHNYMYVTRTECRIRSSPFAYIVNAHSSTTHDADLLLAQPAMSLVILLNTRRLRVPGRMLIMMGPMKNGTIMLRREHFKGSETWHSMIHNLQFSSYHITTNMTRYTEQQNKRRDFKSVDIT